MENIQIFPTQIYKFKYENHQAEKSQWMEYLNNPSNFTNTRPNQNLHFTSPNLKKEPTFFNLTSWMNSCLLEVMKNLGYIPQAQINSFWCTKHVDRGGHGRHSHGNTFLAGVYYLSGSNRHSGTRWFNPNRLNTIIMPAKEQGSRLKNSNSWFHPFEEGTLIIFPGWLEHNTELNNLNRTGGERFIMGFNAMPLGKTNQDEFDRYNYYQAQESDMISNLDERVT
jgi:hypothetical protein